MKKVISVLIVDDSRVARDLLNHMIESDPQLKVAYMASSGNDALQWLKNNTPDVITMDILMPNLNGFEVTRKIMETKPIPIVIISAVYGAKNDAELALKAIEMGALSIIGKPVGIGDSEYYRQSKIIVDTIKMVADVKLIKRRPKSIVSPIKTIAVQQEEFKGQWEAIAICASLGGPLAIANILKDLSKDFALPILIVQHIAAGFTTGFAQWLQTYTKLPIKLSENGEKILPGHIYIAPDRCQMEIKKGNIIKLIYDSQDPLQPSAKYLFKSMAETYGSKGIGVILTGMGKDGAQELLLMKQKGAYTIAQDEESCIMFGMPKEAILLNAHKKILPLEQIGVFLNSFSKAKQLFGEISWQKNK